MTQPTRSQIDAMRALPAAIKARNAVDWRTCPHDYVTSHGRGWECCDCGVGLLSLMCPIPLPTVAQALEVIGAASPSTPSPLVGADGQTQGDTQ